MMSIGFNWFKSYMIEKIEYGIPYVKDDQRVHYIGGGSTSHSAGNIAELQDIFEKYTGVLIPYESDEWFDEKKLINPKKMALMCKQILDNPDIDLAGMRSRIEWIKNLSEQGYYVAYDSE